MSAIRTGGWKTLESLEADLLVDGEVVDRIDFDTQDFRLTIGDQTILTGTGAVASGTFLRVDGADVIVTTGGANLEFIMRLQVIEAIPTDAVFRLGATDDFGGTVRITRPIGVPSVGGGGFGWGTMITAVAIALFAGGFLGNMVASHRRAALRPSIYSTMQRRIDEGRQATDAAAPAGSKPAP